MDNDQIEAEPSCVPPIESLPERNKYGLICNEKVQYIYTDSGLIDWRKMIKPEHLVPNKQVFERANKPIPSTIEGLLDKELLILLAGIKELAFVRGFTKVSYKVVSPSKDYVVAVCEIDWIPNYETINVPVTSSGIGDAHPFNTTSFGKLYLGPIAENRAFVRCVRQFLRINIVSQEEVVESSAEIPSEDPATALLRETAQKYKITFELIKDKLVKEKVENANEFRSFADIPKIKQFELIERIKRKAAEKGMS